MKFKKLIPGSKFVFRKKNAGAGNDYSSLLIKLNTLVMPKNDSATACNAVFLKDGTPAQISGDQEIIEVSI